MAANAYVTPFRLGAPGRQLFALHHAPPAASARREAVLLCNPFGQEAIRCHRLFRVMAERLARNGLHVLRFDYFGTGDSDGDDAQGDVASWIADVRTASEALAARAAVDECSWFGLRLGGTLAALASAQSPRPPRKLVLWDAIVDGSAYLRDLASAHLEAYRASYGARWQLEPALRSSAAQEAASEALGFPLSPPLRTELDALRPPSLYTTRARAVWLFAGPDAQQVGDLEPQLSARGTDVHRRPIVSRIDWSSNEAMNSAIVPADALAAISAALTESV